MVANLNAELMKFGVMSQGPITNEFTYLFDGVAPIFDAIPSLNWWYWNGTRYTSYATYIAAGGPPLDGGATSGATSPWFAFPCTIMFDGIAPATVGFNYGVTLSAGATTNFVSVRFTTGASGANFQITRSNATEAAINFVASGGTRTVMAAIAQTGTVRASHLSSAVSTFAGVVLPTINRLTLNGNGVSSANNWGGSINRVTIFAGAFSDPALRALSSGQYVGSGSSSGCTGAGVGGIISPKGLVYGNYTYFGSVSTGGAQIIMQIDNRTRAFIGLTTVSTTLGIADDHYAPASIITPGGVYFTAWTPHENAANTKVYWKRSSSTTPPDTTVTENTLNLGASNFPSYMQIRVQASTGYIFLFTRVALVTWHVLRSTDDGVSFTDLGVVVDNSAEAAVRFYANFCPTWVDANTLRIFASHAPDQGSGKVRIADYNVTTGVVTSAAGALGTVGSGGAVFSTMAAIDNPGTGQTAFQNDTWHSDELITIGIDDGTAAQSYYYLKLTDTANPYAIASWTKTLIVAAGTGMGGVDKWSGQICIATQQINGRPQVYLCRRNGGGTGPVSNLERWLADNANGTAWTQIATLTSANLVSPTNNVLFRPMAIENSTTVPIVWQTGVYTDFDNWATRLKW